MDRTGFPKGKGLPRTDRSGAGLADAGRDYVACARPDMEGAYPPGRHEVGGCAATDPMGQLFFAAFDQSQRAAVVFAARLGYLRAGARVVSHQALKPFTQILAIGRVLSTRLSAIRSATAQRRPMHAGMADSILRSEGREIRVPAGALKALTLSTCRSIF